MVSVLAVVLKQKSLQGLKIKLGFCVFLSFNYTASGRVSETRVRVGIVEKLPFLCTTPV